MAQLLTKKLSSMRNQTMSNPKSSENSSRSKDIENPGVLKYVVVRNRYKNLDDVKIDVEGRDHHENLDNGRDLPLSIKA